eukprot:scaffold17740_cov69-Phaeocystis_antarctica.AAC.2
MRPGLRESIEPPGADGGNVGARPGVEPCSGALELAEFTRIRPLGNAVCTQAHRQYLAPWTHTALGGAYGGTRLLPGAQQVKRPNSEFVFDERGARLAGGNRPLEGRRGMEPRGRKPSARVYP